MNPLYRELLGSLVRTLAAYVAGKFGVTLLAGDVPAEWVGAVVTAGILGWSGMQKIRARRVLLVALASTRRLAEQEAASLVALAPPVTTPATVVPSLEKG